jgi:hypothetical protein
MLQRRKEEHGRNHEYEKKLWEYRDSYIHWFLGDSHIVAMSEEEGGGKRSAKTIKQTYFNDTYILVKSSSPS